MKKHSSHSFVMGARIAMACRFEVVAIGGDRDDLHSAIERALDEVEALERQLSPFLPESHLSQINALASRKPVKVEPELYHMLRRAVQIGYETGGAFDITVGAITLLSKRAVDNIEVMQLAWQMEFGSSEELPFGLQWLHLDDETMTVCFLRDGIALDLCGIAKGYAVDVVASCLNGYGVRNFFVHAGKSSVYASGAPFGLDGWLVGITDPSDPSNRLVALKLCNMAMGVSEWHSGVEGKSLHIFDPRVQTANLRGIPEEGECLLRAYAICGNATDADALSTAFLLLGCRGVEDYCKQHGDVGAILLVRRGDKTSVLAYGVAGHLLSDAVTTMPKLQSCEL